MGRPAWVRDDLFPFESRFADVDGATVHYIDEGEGPVFLALHGNPTWSFLYRHVVRGLQDRFRCVALDYPGFGLSTAPAGYDFTVGEHAGIVESFVQRLGLDGITLMVQDWGGPIGLAAATRHPERYRALVIGNTWGWPVRDDRSKAMFSTVLGSAIGQFALTRLDLFTNVLLKAGMKRKKLTPEEFEMYKRPHDSPDQRRGVARMPKEILGSELLLEVASGLAKLAHLPALIVWGARDPAFKEHDRLRWERTFPKHRTVVLDGAAHYIQEDAPDEIVQAIREWWPGE